jgi:opacity protein-like surface antigen
MNNKKMSRMLSVALVLVCFISLDTAFSQVAPAAHSGQLGPGQSTFTIGAGASNFDADWGHNRIWGPAFWGQWHPFSSGALAGLGVDAEVRDLDFGRGSTLPSNFKQVAFAGGPIYIVRALHNFQPYAKGLIGFGSFDFKIPGHPYYTHDTRNVYAPGFGFQYHLFHHTWVRADYEYQAWPDLFKDSHTADPQGFTLGLSYDFSPRWR